MIKRTQLTRFRKNEEAAVAIEFAFLAPALVLMTVGVLEFGVYFLRSQSAHNAVAATMTAVLADPTDASNRDLLRANFTDYSNSRNFGCARPFRTQAEANNGVCRAGVWNTNPPRNHEGDYYVLLRSHIAASSTTRLFDALIPQTNIRQVIKISQATDAATCNGDPLENRLCYLIEEGYNVGRSERQTSGNGADRIIYRYDVTSYRRNMRETPICAESGWSCQPHANAQRLNSNYGFSSRTPSTPYAGNSHLVETRLQEANVALPNHLRNCNASERDISIRDSFRPACFSGPAIPPLASLGFRSSRRQ